MLIYVCLKVLIQFIGWNVVWAIPVWGAGGILIFSWLSKAGYKIEVEKKRFERWQKVLISNLEPITAREKAAWGILQSKDVNQNIINDILSIFHDNNLIKDSALDKKSELEVKDPNIKTKGGK